MGNTASWGADLIGNTFGQAATPEPPLDTPTDEEIHMKHFRMEPRRPVKRYMCKHMKRKGMCHYGQACKFAHNKYELCIPVDQFFARKRVRLRQI